MAAEGTRTLMFTLNGSIRDIRDFNPIFKRKEYPHQWFCQNKKKPTLLVKTGTLTNKLRGIVRGTIGGSNSSLDHVLLYLYLVLKEQTEELTEDWKSYGITIGKKGERISPMDLLEVKQNGDLSDMNFNQTYATSADDKWMTRWLLSLYRLDRASEENYKKKIANNLGIHIMKPNYCKIVAVVDMFFYRFEKNPWSDIRLCTTGTRYKGCSALLSVTHVCELMGLEQQAELLHWLSNKTITDEMLSIMEAIDEYSEPFSYFPYHVDLGLVTRSVYSAKGSPAVYTFCHLVGLYYNDQRSINAKYLLEKDIMGVVHNAQWVGYACTIGREAGPGIVQTRNNAQKTVELKRNQKSLKSQDVQLDVTGISKEADEEQSEPMKKKKKLAKKSATSDETFPEPTTRNSNEWHEYICSRGGDLSRDMKEHAIIVSKRLKNVRQGTIGSFAQTSTFIPEL